MTLAPEQNKLILSQIDTLVPEIGRLAHGGRHLKN